jgi:hypothetical protein
MRSALSGKEGLIMRHEPDDGIFASISEDRREFGFQRDWDSAPRPKSRRPRLIACVMLILAVAAAVAAISSGPGKDPVTTTSVH